MEVINFLRKVETVSQLSDKKPTDISAGDSVVEYIITVTSLKSEFVTQGIPCHSS